MIPITHRSRADDVAARPVIVATAAFVQDEHGRVLVQRSADDRWILPGGAPEPGEALGQAIIRILAEATGMTVEIRGLVGIYNEVDDTVERLGRGTARRLSACLRARPLDGQPALGPNLRWAARDELDALPMQDSTRRRICHGLDSRATPHIETRLREPGASRRFPWSRRQRST